MVRSIDFAYADVSCMLGEVFLGSEAPPVQLMLRSALLSDPCAFLSSYATCLLLLLSRVRARS